MEILLYLTCLLRQKVTKKGKSQVKVNFCGSPNLSFADGKSQVKVNFCSSPNLSFADGKSQVLVPII